LCVLNYIATSNHVHLLVRDRGQGEIARSLQLISGRCAQEFNQRKQRHGAFWQDRYHATAVDTDGHLARCMAYIDLNMVRAGAVTHPAQWEIGGYREIQHPPSRYTVIDRVALLELFGLPDDGALRREHARWVDDALKDSSQLTRNSGWSQSVAIGSREFVKRVQRELGMCARQRRIASRQESHCLADEQSLYLVFKPEK
jgi:putative transposase